jgi:mannose-6-phosphate isomerase-like protein (cupin superfamily)
MKTCGFFTSLLAFGLFTAATMAAPVDEIVPAPGYSLKNCITTFDPAKVEKTAVGYQFWFANTALADGKTVKLSVVGPHLATHPPHRHAEDEFFFILEGRAEFLLDEERQVVGPQTLLYCPSWHLHGIRNVGDTELKYLVIKKYLGPVPPAASAPVRSPHAAEPPAKP